MVEVQGAPSCRARRHRGPPRRYPDAPFRTVVGADANLILSAKSSMPFEDFEHAMRSTINWYE